MKKYTLFVDEGGFFGDITIFVGFLNKKCVHSKVPTNERWSLNYVGDVTLEGLCAIKILYEKSYPDSGTVLHVSEELPKNFSKSLKSMQDNWGVF